MSAPPGFERKISERLAAIKRTLEQPSRGNITFDADGKAAIKLFEGRDLSTMIHEGSGRLWLVE